MSRLKRFLFISFLICAAAAAPVAAVDFGGSVYNETSLLKEGIDPLGVGQKNVVSVWFNTGTHNPVTFPHRRILQFSLQLSGRGYGQPAAELSLSVQSVRFPAYRDLQTA